MAFESIKNAANKFKEEAKTVLSNTRSGTPILLLPLRTEVKFLDNTLLVRVYPEAVSIEQHEEKLTESEKKAGEWYWTKLHEKASSQEALWATISNTFGAQRAEWILRQTRPANWEKRRPGIALKFPTKTTKKDSWTEPAMCRTLPEQLMICLQLGSGEIIQVTGKAIPADLQVGPNPQKMATAKETEREFVVPGNEDQREDFNLGGGIAWMTDFKIAVKKGMGFQIKLPANTTRIEWLFVFGVKTFEKDRRKLDATQKGLAALVQLFQSHYYTPDGLSLMPQGAPTKNNEQKSTALAKPLGFEREHYRRSINPAATTTNSVTDLRKPDQQMLAEALGINFDSTQAEEVKKLAPHYKNYEPGAYDYHEAAAMHTALFPATLGYYTELVLGNPFGDHQAGFRDWFIQYATGRGSLPAIKIGKQPYGILPATYFPHLADHAAFPIFQRIAQKTDEELERLMPEVSDIAASDKEMDEKLADILYHHPASVRHWVRLALLRMNRNYFPAPVESDGTPIFTGHNGEKIDYGSVSFEQIFGANDNFNHLPATDFGFEFKAESLTNMPLVTSRVLSEEEGLTEYDNSDYPYYFPVLNYQPDPCNYIEWIKRYYVFYCAYKSRNTWGQIPKNPNFLEKPDPFKPFVQSNGDLTYFLGEETLLSRYLMHAIMHQIHKCAIMWLMEQEGALMGRVLQKIRIEYDYNLTERWPKKGNQHPPYTPLDIIFAPFRTIFNDSVVFEDNYKRNLYALNNNPFDRIGIAPEDITVGEYIYYYNSLMLYKDPYDWTDKLKTELNYLDRLKSSLTTLAQMPTARLERCLVEHFDVLSYRMDAWRSAFCLEKLKNDRGLTSFLAGVRENPQGGLHLGAYGCLINIERDTAKKSVNADDPAMKAFDLKSALEWKHGSGFVHAPSMDQATAGAILKSAHSRFKTLDPAHPEMFAVNLSSARVRQGLYLLEGIQQGQDLGVLLGYQFEREIHDAGLDRLIFDFRRKYPLLPGKLNQFGYDEKSKNLENAGVWPVTDGVAVLAAKDSLPDELVKDELVKAASIDLDNVISIIGNLSNALDALKDLLTAESVYQYAQNNIERASAVLQSVSDLEVPPVLEFIKTPRNTAHTTLHRVAIMFDHANDSGFDQTDDPNDPAAKSLWAGIPVTARAQAEPKLNHWLGKILGDPDDIVCWVAQRNEANDDHKGLYIKASDLGLQPIDLVNLSDQIVLAPETLSGEKPLHHVGAGELEQRVIAAYYHRYKGKESVLSGYKIYINLNKSEQGSRTFVQCLPLLKYLKEVIGNARPMRALDFEAGTNPYPKNINYNNYAIEASGPAGDQAIIDVGNLNARLHKVKAVLFDLQKSLDKIAADGRVGQDLEQQMQQFRKAAEFGIPDAVIQIPVEPTSEAVFQEYLKSRAEEVVKQVKARIGQIAEFQQNFSFRGKDAEVNNGFNYFEDRVERFHELIKSLFNGTVRVFPVFMLGHLGKPLLEKRYNVSYALSRQDDLLKRAKEKSGINSNQIVLEEWLSGAAEVRPNLYALEMAKLMHESAGESSKMPLQLIQMTSSDDEVGYAYDTWLGGPLDAGKKINTNKASVVAVYPYKNANLPYEGGFSGLIVDEWTELIPQAKETTAIAINHDQPLSRAPQALMLAVSSNPDNTQPWTLEEVGATVLYTFTRAMMRGITPDKILSTQQELGRLLPALYAEFMPDGRNMSLDLLHD